jgi:CubicO group peptidase (beta-lactamase class C family)
MTAAHWNALILVLFFSIASSAQIQASSQPTTTDWPTASSAQVSVSEARLRSLDAAIRSEEFKKIGSVLIARHGKLVYESYFDGDAATLQDTRSATKSITDILIGIAIEEHKLSGVDAKVLALLPGTRPRILTPAKPRSRWKIF